MTSNKNIINSALWAAYGDALGFITELANEKTLKWRAGTTNIEKTIPWRRRIGGKFGVIVDLPVGCYSDDTQLRLATSRAIRADGKFDVEAFAKIEIPVWLSYSLGAGRGSKDAAMSLTKRDIAWSNNFFKNKNSHYINGGGNGAAMRIQPHVWASSNRKHFDAFLPDVIRNAVCTHGHSRGILGAVFHACSLADAIENQEVHGPDDWDIFVDNFILASKIIKADSELSRFWLPEWETLNLENIEDSFAKVTKECIEDIRIAKKYIRSTVTEQEKYVQFVKEIGGMAPESRGSGTKTAIIALFLAWLYQGEPHKAMRVAANYLGSDTDTIATMAGSILGAVVLEAPQGNISDQNYIVKEAYRLHSISKGDRTESFAYPDLLLWSSPSTQSDFVGTVDNEIALAGLGIMKAIGSEYEQKGKSTAIWRWFELNFGQKVLAKQRLTLSKIPDNNMPIHIYKKTTNVGNKKENQKGLFEIPSNITERIIRKTNKISIDAAIQEAMASGLSPSVIGSLIVELSKQTNGIELAIGFSSIIAQKIKSKIKD